MNKIIDFIKKIGISTLISIIGNIVSVVDRMFLFINKIENKKILFLHTGGTPLFFDYYREEKFKI